MEQFLLSLRRPSVDREVYDQDIEFQLVDILEVSTPILDSPTPQDNQELQKAPLITNYILFGLTAQGQSISVAVMGFSHYLYAGTNTFLDRDNLRSKLSMHLGFRPDSQEPVTEIVQMPSTYRSIYVLKVQKKYIYRIKFTDKNLYSKIRSFFLEAQIYNGKYGIGAEKFELYEADLNSTVRFMVDTHLRGFAWIRLEHGKYSPLSSTASQVFQTTAQIQLQTDYFSLIPLDYNTPAYAVNSPLRVMSFDIESVSLQGGFPNSESDYIITICASLYILTQSTADNVHANVALVLNTCAPIADAEVFSFENERDLLIAFNYLIQLFDPDVFTGYNIDGFDFNYIFKRAEVDQAQTNLLLGTMSTDQLLSLIVAKGNQNYTSTLSRSSAFPASIAVSHMQSKQMGRRDTYEFTCPGRISMDVLPNIIHNYKLRSYTLNSVCAKFLNEQKDDVHYSMITPLFKQDEYGRRKITQYCIKDCKLPLKLMEKLMILVNTIELCRVTGLYGSLLLYSGQQIRILSLLYRFSAEEFRLIPFNARTTNSYGKAFGESESIEGATVLNPQRGFYSDKQPIATLDFNSLYPTIIIAHNLCYSTLVTDSLDIDYLTRVYLKSQSDVTVDAAAYRQKVLSLLRLEGAPVSTDANIEEVIDSDSFEDSNEAPARSNLRSPTDAQKETATLCLSASNELLTVTPIRVKFLKADMFPGILPKILRVLLDARAKAKKDMKKATDMLTKDVLNGRQLALKITANSLYGFTGALSFGKLPSQEISSSITAFGREMINQTKSVVEARFHCKQPVIDIDLTNILYKEDHFVQRCLAYCDKQPIIIPKESSTDQTFDDPLPSPPAGLPLTPASNNTETDGCLPSPPRLAPDGRIICSTYHYVSFNQDRTIMHYRITHNAVVIYGDTDSVMVKFGVDNVMEAMLLAKYAATYVTQSFIKPINLEFEKVYCPYLLLSKKRYAGQYWTNPIKPDKIDSKGLELVRRDNCRLVVIVMEKVLDILFNHSSPQKAINYVKSVVHDLISQRIDLSLLVISKALTQSPDKYTNKQQTHVNLAIRMKERDPMTAPKVGDRIPYIITLKDKTCKLYERSEDPVYAISHNLPIDTDYYLHQQLKKPISRLLKDILRCSSETEAADQLFRGKHCVGSSIVFSHADLDNISSGSKKATNSSLSGKGTKQMGIMGMVTGKKVIKCMYCNIRIMDGKIYEDMLLCKACLLTNRISLYSRLQRELALAEYRYRIVAVECMLCTGEISSSVGDIEDGLIPCSSSDCELFYARIKTKLEYKTLRQRFDALSRFKWF